ncbi:MAG: protocatechuate 3,4-dioxygenase subunit beta [Burkholderiales bacterium]
MSIEIDLTINTRESCYTVPRIAEPTQAPRIVDGYQQTSWRTPARVLHRRPLTPSELTGPTDLSPRLGVLGADVAGHGALRALGQLIHLRLAIRDEDGSPVAGTMVEMWQANAAGRYAHPNDNDHAPLDPHFQGAARVQTDASGMIEIRTIKPGAYPVPGSERWWRPPHIHFSVWGKVWLSRVVTQMYFPGEVLNGQDFIFNAVPDQSARERQVARALPTSVGPPDALVFEHTIIVRGKRATPAAH